jgi:hypothetical protein
MLLHTIKYRSESESALVTRTSENQAQALEADENLFSKMSSV